MISYGKQSISLRDRFQVFRALGAPNLTQGLTTPLFESELSKFTNSLGAVAFNSATSALHAACLALEVGVGDVVWTSAISFVASANCAIYCGAEVDFVDVEVETGNISIEALEIKLRHAANDGKLPKVIIPVHFAGQPCDMRKLAELREEFGFKIIEDASHALGATYAGSPIGSCEFSDITVFSFHPVKMITTGEGGMTTTNSDKLLKSLRLTRSHGITRDPESTSQIFDGPWSYDQIAIGYNFRMTDFQAALGLSQLSRLKKFVAKRTAMANLYRSALMHTEWQPLNQKLDRTNSYHLFMVQNMRGISVRRETYDKLLAGGIMPNVHYRPIYRNSFYARMGKYDPNDFDGAEAFYENSITLPLFTKLKKSQVRKVINLLSKG